MNNFEVHIYTDGAARGNPGPGGYGIVMQWAGTAYSKEFSQGYRNTTNNRMELLAIIVALEKLKKTNTTATVYTDSKYVVNSVEKKWVFTWEKKAFKGRKNNDLWIRFLKVYRAHSVKLVWIKGHNGHSQNERCDKLATAASRKKILQIDTGFEQNT